MTYLLIKIIYSIKFITIESKRSVKSKIGGLTNDIKSNIYQIIHELIKKLETETKKKVVQLIYN